MTDNKSTDTPSEEFFTFDDKQSEARAEEIFASSMGGNDHDRQEPPPAPGPYAKYTKDPIKARKLAVEAIVVAKHPEYRAILAGEESSLLQMTGHPMCDAPRRYMQVAQTGQEAEVAHALTMLGLEERKTKRLERTVRIMVACFVVSLVAHVVEAILAWG